MLIRLGMRIMNFDAFVQDIISNRWNVYGVEVYEKGCLTHSFGDTCDNIHEIYSATKSILSIAMGMAWDGGLIDLERSVLDYLPEEKKAGMSAAQKEDFQKITIKRLLTMSVKGFPFRAEGESWLDFALSCKIENPDEKRFDYSNITAYLAGVALSNALGCDLGSFVEERLLVPLGIDRYEYSRCPEGYFYGASGMKLTVNELSRIGLLMYNGGVYNGRRLLSEEYVKQATTIRQMNREGGYGYFFWKYRDGFSINGKWKQKCYILPDSGLMVTYLCNIQEDSDTLKDSMEKNILGITAS